MAGNGRFNEPRLSEVCRLYGEIGFDVQVEPFVPDASGACSECMKACPGRFMTVYTRNSIKVRFEIENELAVLRLVVDDFVSIVSAMGFQLKANVLDLHCC